MKIKINDNVPDSTYFTMSDVEPVYDSTSDTLTLVQGEGSRRSWGRPAVWSSVVFRGRDLVAVHVGFSHKHRGGQGWHYWQRQGGTWIKVVWGKLSDTDRQKVLDRMSNAPSWAKAPGKLRSEAKPPASAEKVTGYKIVKADGDTLRSLYDNSVVYELGREYSERAQDDHRGGFYFYTDMDAMLKAWGERNLVPARCLEDVEHVAIIEVQARGRQISYGRKAAATYIRPLRVIELIEVANV